jgi:predicted YcjX-like family ATPase
LSCGKQEGTGVRLSDITDATAEALRKTGLGIADLATPTLRLGVTGLARSGKTVFITALVRNLIAGGRLPYFSAMAQARITRAYLEPQPDDRLARFPYEEHLSELARDPPEWPDSTRTISQLRLTVEYEPASALHRLLLPGRLHVDIVDYPGEWLLDLPLLDLDFTAWSQRSMAEAERRGTGAAAKTWLSYAATLSPDAPADEQVARRGADIFTAYLQEARAPGSALAAPGPGRFLMPGDAAGSPLLTFFPLPMHSAAHGRGTLAAMLARRYESYKTHIVKPFFRDHFARLDRQIVLIDALSALNSGSNAVDDLQRTMEAVLECFKPAAHSWLSRILTRRLDRLLFAATKADRLHHINHDRLEAILGWIADKAIARAQFAGANVKVMALAALRTTREASARSGGQTLPCIVGVPLKGEQVGRQLFDGRAEAAVFPGDLPEDPAALKSSVRPNTVQFPRFRPPRLDLDAADSAVWPHIRLDRAIDFLLGDWLA